MLRVLAIAFALAFALLDLARAADFLDPNQAFKVAAQTRAPGTVELVFDIRAGHYMYREKFAVQTGAGAELSLHVLPPGEQKFDEAFQRQMEIHRGTVRVLLTLDPATTVLQVSGQGCADKGLCYAPMTSTLTAGNDGRWTLSPGNDPAGEFGPAAVGVPSTAQTGWGVWGAVFAALLGLILLSRRF